MRAASALALAVTAVFAPARFEAQATATAPTIGPPPGLTVPTVQHAVLANGLRIELVSMTELPLAQVTLVVDGGARLDGKQSGITAFTAGMLDEGAGTRDAFAFAAQLDYLGASLQAQATWDAVLLTLRAPVRTMTPAMTLLADAVLRPRFSRFDIERQRDLRISEIVQARDEPNTVAHNALYRNMYPAGHPYHAPQGGDSVTVAAFDSAAIRTYWSSIADPRHSTLMVTGDLTLAQARSLAEGALGTWRSPRTAITIPAAATIGAPAPAPRRIVLVDRPDAEQSVILVGLPMPPRSSPDYAALAIVDALLGGSFSSRLNDILREQKGWVYHATSQLEMRPVPGPLVVWAPTRTDVTDSAVAVIVRQLELLRTELVPEVELERVRRYTQLGALRELETTGQVSDKLVRLHGFGFPVDTLSSLLVGISRLTAEDVRGAAQRHIDPNHLTIVVVGDAKKVQPGLEALGLGPVEIQDIEQP